jgi:3-hydroxybutyryl-CoA dehydrogenase
MDLTGFKNILLAGTGRMASGVVTALLKAGADVHVVSDDAGNDKKYVADNAADWKRYEAVTIDTCRLHYIPSAKNAAMAGMAISITEENLAVKQRLVRELEETLSPEAIIALNTESFLLEDLQQNTKYPGRIIGLNWCDPAHTTAFLEIIGNRLTPDIVLKKVAALAVKDWSKDPYTLHCGYSIRARFMAAFAREAFYLVENGYALVEDIDRACRNDAGYYLPFAGNCRYMDLMGTYAYGLVMKDLNRELSKQDKPPLFFTRLSESGKWGMQHKEGFYQYTDGEEREWEKRFRKFSFEIKEIIEKYPFNYLNKESEMVGSKLTFNE